MRRTLVISALAFASASAANAQAAAQQCALEYETSSGNTRTNAQRLPSGQYNFFQGGGVTYHCAGQGNTLIADSAEYYGEQRVLYLIGDVHYTETRAKVDSDRMTYYQVEDRIRAEGNVVVRTQSGTTMRGPVMDYYRQTTMRPLARTVATGRPRMSIIQRQNPNQPPEPVDVVSNQLVAEGDNFVYASGNVEVTRPDLLAKGDSAFMDGQHEFARLMKSPSVQSRKGTPFTLTGGVIDLYSRNKNLERVVATPSGHVLSRDLELAADSVDLRVKDNQLQRVIAWGRSSRATALTPERRILADSIDALMPDQRIREVRAIGSAYANSAPDSARIISTERDWMRGDSVVAEFDSIAPGDTTTKPQAKRIVAKGNASSFYQMAGSGSVKARPNLNYVRGRVITVSFVNRTVDRVDVLDKASGLFLEPSSDSTAARGAAARGNSSTPQAPPPPPTSRKQKP